MSRRAAKGDSSLITWRRLYTIIQTADEAKAMTSTVAQILMTVTSRRPTAKATTTTTKKHRRSVAEIIKS
jgi:hypothetical protein